MCAGGFVVTITPQRIRTTMSLAIKASAGTLCLLLVAAPVQAQGLVMQRNLSLALAKTIAEATLAECQSKGFHTAAAVGGPRRPGAGDAQGRTRLGADGGDGATKGLHRADVPSPHVGISKAVRRATRASCLNATCRTSSRWVAACPSGRRRGDRGVGSSGSSQETDESCAKAGLAKVGDILK